MNNPVGWFEIYVDDMARARAFYERVLQTTLDKLEGPDVEMYAFPMDQSTVGSAGALVRMEGVKAGGGGTLVYFRCDDCTVEASRAKAAGGRVYKDKFSIGGHGHIALVIDSESNMIGLHSMQ